MNYNFDELIVRRGTGCVKWDETPATVSDGFPSGPDILPLWVADMDFAVAPAIQEAVQRRAQHPVFGYTYVQDDYYDAVISWFQRRHHWTIQRARECAAIFPQQQSLRGRLALLRGLLCRRENDRFPPLQPTQPHRPCLDA